MKIKPIRVETLPWLTESIEIEKILICYKFYPELKVSFNLFLEIKKVEIRLFL